MSSSLNIEFKVPHYLFFVLGNDALEVEEEDVLGSIGLSELRGLEGFLRELGGFLSSLERERNTMQRYHSVLREKFSIFLLVIGEVTLAVAVA